MRVWQRQRLERYLDALGVSEAELGDQERQFLVWLAGWDFDVETGFVTIVERLRRSGADQLGLGTSLRRDEVA